MNPKISVIIPAYNIESYLPRCLESIINQTYAPLEIIVVDDGSSDSTGVVADSFAEKYPDKIVVKHKPNGGVTKARLAGIEYAIGDWIGFVDGDDEIEPDMYERLIGNALKYDADISHCGYQTVVNDGERIHYFHNTGRLVLQDHIQGMRDLIQGEFIEPSLCNKIYRRAVIDAVLEENQMKEQYRISEDLLMNYLLFSKAEKSVFEDICPYHYMSRVNSASRSDFKLYRALDPVGVWHEILENVPDSLREIAWRKYLSSCHNAYESLFDRKDYAKEAAELKQELLEHKNKWKLLSKKGEIKLWFLLFMPRMYALIMRYYRKKIQKKVYE